MNLFIVLAKPSLEPFHCPREAQPFARCSEEGRVAENVRLCLSLIRGHSLPNLLRVLVQLPWAC